MRWAILGLTGCTRLLGVHEFAAPDAELDVDAPPVEIDAPRIVDAPPPDADSLSVGLLAHLTFDGSPIGLDVTGDGHDGTCTNQCPAAQGKLGLGIRFDGVGEMTLANPLPTTPFSIAVWIKIANANDNNLGCAISREKVTQTGYALCFTKNQAEIVVPNGSRLIPLASTTGFHHYGVTWDGTVVLTYVDGAQVDSRTADLAAVNSKLFVGWEGHVNQFIGDLDDLRYYERVLSPDELQLLTGGNQ